MEIGDVFFPFSFFQELCVTKIPLLSSFIPMEADGKKHVVFSPTFAQVMTKPRFSEERRSFFPL